MAQVTFISPHEHDKKRGALRSLGQIRLGHPFSKGWKEIKGYTEKLPNGKWRAVCIYQEPEGLKK